MARESLGTLSRGEPDRLWTSTTWEFAGYYLLFEQDDVSWDTQFAECSFHDFRHFYPLSHVLFGSHSLPSFGFSPSSSFGIGHFCKKKKIFLVSLLLSHTPHLNGLSS